MYSSWGCDMQTKTVEFGYTVKRRAKDYTQLVYTKANWPVSAEACGMRGREERSGREEERTDVVQEGGQKTMISKLRSLEARSCI